MTNEWWETVLLIFGCVAALLFLLWGVGRMSSGDDDEITATLDTPATLHLLADVAAEAHAQGTEAQRAMEELREIAPQLEAEDWQLFEDRYRETLQAFSTGKAEINDQMEHLERTFRRDRVIGQARRDLRES